MIIVCDQAPVKWFYQQLQFYSTVKVERKKEMKIIAVFNQPSQIELKSQLETSLPNLKILGSLDDIKDYLPKFIEEVFA